MRGREDGPRSRQSEHLVEEWDSRQGRPASRHGRRLKRSTNAKRSDQVGDQSRFARQSLDAVQLRSDFADVIRLHRRSFALARKRDVIGSVDLDHDVRHVGRQVGVDYRPGRDVATINLTDSDDLDGTTGGNVHVR